MQLLNHWSADSALPLFVRRASAGRGRVILHRSGREIVPTDNSPAHWALALALAARVPSPAEVRKALSEDAIPVALVIKKSEQEHATYRCTRMEVSLNALGWKVAHLEDVGLGRVDLQETPIDRIIAHFHRFLWPGNMFVVPLLWAGLAELPEMVDAIRKVGPEDA